MSSSLENDIVVVEHRAQYKIGVILHANKQGTKDILFKIPIRNGFAYMKTNHSFLGGMGLGGPEKIMIVDSHKFLKLWQNDQNNSERHLAFGDELIWRKDYKFHYAEKGFSHGITNPVPLAYVHCYLTDVRENFISGLSKFLFGKDSKKKIPYCAFTNGITRTIWLLANGAECFPVMTDIRSYELLLMQAGICESEEIIKSMLCSSSDLS